MLIFCDIDGTLLNNDHRKHLLPTETHRTDLWDVFNLACKDDEPLIYRIQMVRLMAASHELVYLTGRSDICREFTLESLAKHECPDRELIMRPRDDHRKGYEFKAEAIGIKLKKRGITDFALIDDDETICNHIGIRYPSALVIQVPSYCCAYKREAT